MSTPVALVLGVDDVVLVLLVVDDLSDATLVEKDTAAAAAATFVSGLAVAPRSFLDFFALLLSDLVNLAFALVLLLLVTSLLIVRTSFSFLDMPLFFFSPLLVAPVLLVVLHSSFHNFILVRVLILVSSRVDELGAETDLDTRAFLADVPGVIT